MTPYEYLQQMPEAMPPWLEQFKNGDAFSPEQFFASRIVFYPGSGTDGQPVKLFGSVRSAHTFVYADYGVTQAALEAELGCGAQRFRGYDSLARVSLSERELAPNGWRPHPDAVEMALPDRNHIVTSPFGFLEILVRKQNFDDSHGPRRLCILFLGADGIAAYDALFCQQNGTPPPFVVVVQDHNLGGNYNRFGQSGFLEKLARSRRTIPQLLLVAENTNPWREFERVKGVDGDSGGMHRTMRFLHKRRGERP